MPEPEFRSEKQRPSTVATPTDDKKQREIRFKLENAEAFASMNAWVEENGLPLEKYRQF